MATAYVIQLFQPHEGGERIHGVFDDISIAETEQNRINEIIDSGTEFDDYDAYLHNICQCSMEEYEINIPKTKK